MQIFTLSAAEQLPYTAQYRYTAMGPLVAFVTCVVWMIGSASVMFGAAYVREWVALIFSIVPVVFGLAALQMWRELRIRTRNMHWLLRLQADGILVNFRWYSNRSLLNTEDPTVCRVNFSEIEWFREHFIELKFSPNVLRDVEPRNAQHLEIKLRDTAAARKMKEQLFMERQRFPEPALWDGIGQQGLLRRFPVTMVDESTLRIEWGVRPGVKNLLRKVAHVSSVTRPKYTHLTLRKLADRPKTEPDSLLSFLVESGQTNYAIRAVGQIVGNKWTDADVIQEVRRISARSPFA